jgi:hypothetical protein
MAYVAGAISVSLPGVIGRALAPVQIVALEGVSLTLSQPGGEADETADALSRRRPIHVARIPGRFRRRLWTKVARLLPRRLWMTLPGGVELSSSPNLLEELQRQEAAGDQPEPHGTTRDATAIRRDLWRRTSGLLHGVVTPPAVVEVRETLEDRWPQLSARQIAAVVRRAENLASELAGELDLPNTLLVGDQPEIFAEADRARAEADFRLALVLPSLALVMVLAITGGWWWLAGLLSSAALLTTGLAKQDEARTFIRNSIQSGKTPSPAAERFVDFVNRQSAGRTGDA